MQSQQQFLHPFASQYNLPPHVANWRQGQPIPQGWRLGRKGYLKPIFTPTGSLASWQQGQPLPQGYRLSKRGTLRPVNYFNWYSSSFGGQQQPFMQQQQFVQQQQFLSPQQTQVLPAQVEFREKPAVVQEVIKGSVREEIQPVIHRERDQLEIREEIQPIYEKSVRPTLVEQRNLAPEMRPEVRLGQMPVLAPGPQGSTLVEAEQRQMYVKPAIVEETVHKKIIEEVQPVIHREVLAPRVINERKDIYEKVVEAPTVSYTTLPAKYAGGQQFQQQGTTSYVTTTTTTTYSHPFASQYGLPPHIANWQQGQPIPQGWRLGRKGYLKPAFNMPQQHANWQQGQPIPQGWRLGRKGYLKPAFNVPHQHASWQQGQPLPEGFRLTKSGSLRPINEWNYWSNLNKMQQQPYMSSSFAPSPISQF